MVFTRWACARACFTSGVVVVVVVLVTRDFKKLQRQPLRNVTWKYNFALVVLLRDYSNSYNLYNVAEPSSDRIGGNGVYVETENEKFTVVCSFSFFHKTLNLAISLCFLAKFGEEMYQNRRLSSFLTSLLLVAASSVYLSWQGHAIFLVASPRVANTTTAVATASSNLRTFGTNSGTAPKSAAKIAQDLMRSKGISGLYKGLGATLARYTLPIGNPNHV